MRSFKWHSIWWSLTFIHYQYINNIPVIKFLTRYTNLLGARLSSTTFSSYSRCSRALSSPRTMQTLRIQTISWLGLKWSVGGTTSSHSMGSWERSTLLCSSYIDVSTTPQLDDPLLRSCCNNWRQWGPRLRGHMVRVWELLWIWRRWGHSGKRTQRSDDYSSKCINWRWVVSISVWYT